MLKIVTLVNLVLLVNCIVFSQTKHSRFEQLWTDFDLHYSYFKEKNINWDSVKTIYGPKFSKKMSVKKEARLLGEVIMLLNDYHVSLTTSYGIYKHIPPKSTTEKTEFIDSIFPVHIYTDETSSVYKTKDSLVLIKIFNLDNEIIPDSVIMNQIYSSKGIIIDLSENAGGNETFSRMFVERLISDTITYKSYRFTTGLKRNNFTQWKTATITPNNTVRFNKKIVIIIDGNCFSSCEAFALMLRSMPNCCVIGQNTGGSSGFPKTFTLDNGWTYSISTWQEADITHNLIEGNGVSPDFKVLMNSKYREASKIIKSNK